MPSESAIISWTPSAGTEPHRMLGVDDLVAGPVRLTLALAPVLKQTERLGPSLDLLNPSSNPGKAIPFRSALWVRD